MRHSRFELGFTRSRRVAALSDAAFRLWVSAIDYAREQCTDGEITEEDLDVIPRCPKRGPKRTAIVRELTDAGRFEICGRKWTIHNFLRWQDSSDVVEKKRAAARERMQAVRANNSRTLDERSMAVRDTGGERTSSEVRDGPSTSPSDLDLPSSLPSPGSDSKRARGRRRPRVELPEPFPEEFAPALSASEGWPAWWVENRTRVFCDKAKAADWHYADWKAALRNFLDGEIGYRRGPEDLAHLATKHPDQAAVAAAAARDAAQVERLRAEARGASTPPSGTVQRELGALLAGIGDPQVRT